MSEHEMTIGFIGNPNCGKTTLFNAYTGANLKVANWPGVTVEKVEGVMKDHDLTIHLVDLPGTYSLTSYTMEETVSRQFILSDEVDVIINVADASALERSLYLTLQLLELGKPVVLALNMINDAPVLRRADIGIAMGAMGSDAAIEAADVVLMDDDPMQISKAIKISRKCLGIVYQNIVVAIGVKLACLVLIALGFANMWLAVFADVGVMIIAVLNAIRALFVKNLQSSEIPADRMGPRVRYNQAIQEIRGSQGAMYDICLTVSAWCIIGLLGVLFIRSLGFREFHQEKIIPWLVGIAMIFFLIALMFN